MSKPAVRSVTSDSLIMDAQTPSFDLSVIPAVNVATVPQRSPLRYPGGKTWLIPHIRAWLTEPAPLLVDAFAGGGIVSLTAVMEGLANEALMVDLDRDVSSFWRCALEHSDALIARILKFDPDRRMVQRLARKAPQDVVDHGFRTLVLNRTRRGGVLAPGAALTKNGENGKGVASRWYPDTLAKRLRDIAAYSDRLMFCEGDGVRMLELLSSHPGARFFVDPPYTGGGGKRAGARLYAHNAVDHVRIFRALADSQADFLMTYDCSPEIVSLVHDNGFHAVTVQMKNGHHEILPELVITRDKLFS